MHFFCTYFDRYYLSRGLALYRSLHRHCQSFTLWVLCMDELTHEALSRMRLPSVCLISLEDLEQGDERLLEAKQNRSRIEYYFTCTPSLGLYILSHWPHTDVITYVDADLFFFSDPAPIYRELGDGSIGIVSHRFPPHLKNLEMFGVYNVGWVSFRNDQHGLQALRWWRERCLEWCYDHVEDGRFADQKYLDDWPSRFSNVVVLSHQGSGLAPWNLSNYVLRLEENQVLVDSQPLVFFHFHGVQQLTPWLYDPGLAPYGVRLDSALKQGVYAPYIRELRDAGQWLAQFADGFRSEKGSIRGTAAERDSLGGKVLRKMRALIDVTKMFLSGQLLLLIGSRVV